MGALNVPAKKKIETVTPNRLPLQSEAEVSDFSRTG
jgi:hypothetical protein